MSIAATLLIALAFGDLPSMPANLTIFLFGMGLSFVVLFGGMIVMGVRRPSGIQRAAVIGSIGLESALFALRPHLTGPLTPAGNWIAALMIVGIHFIPFAIALGLEIAILGLCGTADAALANRVVTAAVWISIDAFLKIGFGLWIFLKARVAMAVCQVRFLNSHRSTF